MAFTHGKRFGSLWEDAKKLTDLINSFNFYITGKNEREFELSFSNVLAGNGFSNKVITQTNKQTTVNSVYCFGKKHRPDMTIEDDGIAIEIKYVDDNTDGLKQVIGQSILYRQKYKFAFNILVLSGKNKELYYKIVNKEESDLDTILKHLSEELNVFTFIVPAFNLDNNIKKSISYFE